MEVFAPAKVNLALHVVGRRADGRHELDSLVAFAQDLGDRLTLATGDGLAVTGPFAAGVPTDDRNLVRCALAAAGALRSVVLEKNLPHQAGIGGGSSDAAAALRAVGASVALEDLMAIGADLPVCLMARAARMRGVGEQVEPIALPRLPAVLVNPGTAVPTGAVFKALVHRDNSPLPAMPSFPDVAAAIRWLRDRRNDLEPVARHLVPEISSVLDAVTGTGAGFARMSGSGATCFGLYESDDVARVAARKLARPGWWAAACTLA